MYDRNTLTPYLIPPSICGRRIPMCGSPPAVNVAVVAHRDVITIIIIAESLVVAEPRLIDVRGADASLDHAARGVGAAIH